MARPRVESVGMSRFGKRDASLIDLIAESFEDLCSRTDFHGADAIFFGGMNPEEFCSDGNQAVAVSDRLGLTGLPSIRVETASSTGAAVIQEGARAIISGQYESVLCIAAEKMTHLETRKTTKILAEVIAPSERMYGATMPALAALITRRYMHEYGMTREALAKVAVKSHANGVLNPYAHFQKKIDEGKVLGSKVVSDPLTIYDCAPISDGACCAVLSSTRGPVRIIGTGQSTDTLAIADRQTLTSFSATRRAAARAFDAAGISPSDIDVAEVHDAFTSFEIIGTEDLGFFEPGQGWRAVERGATELNGELPVNPSGGLKARGHPVGASGLAQAIEIFLQLSGDADGRQIDARHGLAQSLGGLANNNFVTIMEAVD